MTRRLGRDSRTVGLLAVFGAVVCFALSYSVLKWPKVPGAVVAWWRLVGSSIMWWIVLLVRRARTGRPLPTRATWKRTVAPGLLFGINISVLFTAITRTSIAHAEFIAAMLPFVMIPAGFTLFGERPKWRALMWGTLSLVGIAIVLFLGPKKGVATLNGDLLAVLGLASLSSYLLASKHARGAHGGEGVDTWEFMAIVMPVALITATPVAFSIAGDEMWPLSGKTWAAAAIMSVLTGMVAHGMLAFAHRIVPIATMSTIQVSQPAFSVFFAWLFLEESIRAVQIPGMALVMIGMALVMWFSQGSPKTETTSPTRRADDAIPPTLDQPAR